jgi:folylpolyglutamate synthase/dihydropteroate synthase
MAARYWFQYAKHYADSEAEEDWMLAFACVHGRERGYLEGLRDPVDIQRALGEFIGGITATKGEVDRAVYYAVVGVPEPKPEKTEIAKAREAERTPSDVERENFAGLESVLADAAAATGLTFDDLMCQTPSRLRGMIYSAHVIAGMKMTKTSARAHADYLATLHAITERLRAEKAARDAKGGGGDGD